MRAFLFLAASTLSLGACGDNDRTENRQTVEESLTADDIVANDVTAIDAVTADAANMAADVDIDFTNEQIAGGNSAGEAPASGPRPRRPAAAAGNTADNGTD
jgi:hypothetical protein